MADVYGSHTETIENRDKSYLHRQVGSHVYVVVY